MQSWRQLLMFEFIICGIVGELSTQDIIYQDYTSGGISNGKIIIVLNNK